MSKNNVQLRRTEFLTYLFFTPRIHKSQQISLRNSEIPSELSLVMAPIQIDTTGISKRQNQNQFIVYFKVFFLGVVFTSLAFLIFNSIWNHFLHPALENGNIDTNCRKRVIGYYNGWDNRKIREKQIEKLTHIIFDGLEIKSNGMIEFESDEKKLLFLDMKNKASAMKSDVKIMFSTDGYSANLNILSPIMADSKMRKVWINSITSFLIDHQIDGVELYYRWPKTKEDNENYIFFCRELRYKLEKMEKLIRRSIPYLISVKSPPSVWPTSNEMDLHELLNSVDFLNIETDNFNGPAHLKNYTGPFSPLYSSTGQNKSIDWTLNAYTCKTMMPSRLNIVVPFRGVEWKNVKNTATATDKIYRTRASVVVNATDSKTAPWRILEKNGWNLTTASWHEESKTPFIWNSKTRRLLTFENERSIKEKMKYVIEKNLGGISIRTLEFDDDANTLLNAVTSVETCSGKKFEKGEIKYTCEDMERTYHFSVDMSVKQSLSYNFLFYAFLFIFYII